MRSRRQPVESRTESVLPCPARRWGGPRWVHLVASARVVLWVAATAALAAALLPVGGCNKDDGPTANTSVQDVNAPGEFLGNEANTVVHRIDCVAANNVQPLYRQSFPRVADAMAKGYRPCKLCLPHVVGTPVAGPAAPKSADGDGAAKPE